MKFTYEHKPAMTFIGFSAAIRPEEGYRNIKTEINGNNLF